MNPYFTKPIKTADDAIVFFFVLEQGGLLFHPEDDPASVVNATGEALFSPDECVQLRARLDEAFEVMDDPCQYILDMSIVYGGGQ